MALQSPDYKRLFLEEQRSRQEAERAQEEAEHAQEAAERAQEAAERAQEEERHRRENAEEKTRKTTLPEFLDACHVHLHSGLTVQTDATLSTRGDPANANYKHRPERIRAWEEFPVQQEGSPKWWETEVNAESEE
jgi:FKBP-type peptidyl-prolyl cis-trans isomerase